MAFRGMEVKLSPLTPVHVWSGDVLVVGYDIVVKDGDACIVDVDQLPTEVIEKVADDLAPLDRYADKVKCSRVLKLRSDLSSKLVYDISPWYVPASTLKGYIRTALLYKWLGERQDAMRLIEQAVKQGRGSLLEDSLMRMRSPRVDVMQSLRIWETKIKEETAIVDIHVKRLPSLSSVAKVSAVALVGGELRYGMELTPFRPKVRDQTGKLADAIKLLEKLPNLGVDHIREALRQFGCKLLENEIELAKGHKKLAPYVEALEEWRSKYCKAGEACVIARMGRMTGIYSKTVISIIREKMPEVYRMLLEKHFHKRHEFNTLKLVEIDGRQLGVGWCEICLT